uniref:Dynamin (Fragments) n=1 Tax=Bos taurus TaxID=9913 RepID=Q7M2R8_BOVIN
GISPVPINLRVPVGDQPPDIEFQIRGYIGVVNFFLSHPSYRLQSQLLSIEKYMLSVDNLKHIFALFNTEQ